MPTALKFWQLSDLTSYWPPDLQVQVTSTWLDAQKTWSKNFHDLHDPHGDYCPMYAGSIAKSATYWDTRWNRLRLMRLSPMATDRQGNESHTDPQCNADKWIARATINVRRYVWNRVAYAPFLSQKRPGKVPDAHTYYAQTAVHLGGELQRKLESERCCKYNPSASTWQYCR